MSLNKDISEVGTFAREIVLKRVAIVAFLAVILQIAVSYGWITGDISAEATTWINRGIDIVALIVGATYTRVAVTTADPALVPLSKNGFPLVEQGADSTSTLKPNGSEPSSLGDPVFAPENVEEEEKTVEDPIATSPIEPETSIHTTIFHATPSK